MDHAARHLSLPTSRQGSAQLQPKHLQGTHEERVSAAVYEEGVGVIAGVSAAAWSSKWFLDAPLLLKAAVFCRMK
jgi:hypothetical protein